MNTLTAPAVALAAAFVAAPALAVPVTFDDFTTLGGGFADNASTATNTVDGVTLTASTTVASTVFQSTNGGTGIETIGESAVAGNNDFQVNTGETFTFSFDTPGTLTGFTIRAFPQSSTVTVTNESGDSGTGTATSTSGLASPIQLPFNVSFEADEALTFNTLTVGAGGSSNSAPASASRASRSTPSPSPPRWPSSAPAVPSCSAVAARADADPGPVQAVMPVPRCHHLQVVSDPVRLTT